MTNSEAKALFASVHNVLNSWVNGAITNEKMLENLRKVTDEYDSPELNTYIDTLNKSYCNEE